MRSDHLPVQGDVGGGERGHRILLGSVRARLHEPGRETGFVENATNGVGQGLGVPRFGEQGIDSVSRHVLVALDGTGHDRGVRGHRLDEDHAETLASEGGCTEHVGLLQPGDLLVVGDPSEPDDSGVTGELEFESLGVGSARGDPEMHVRGEGLMGGQQDIKALTRFVATAEEDVATPGWTDDWGRRTETFEFNPVGKDLVVAPEITLGQEPGILGDRHPAVDPVGHPSENRIQVSVAAAVPRRMEGGHDRRRPHDEGRECRSRGQGLVEVKDVESLVDERAYGSKRGRRIGGQRSDRTVGRGGERLPERGHEGVRRSPVTGSENTDLVSHATKLSGQTHHLTLHSARNGQAVGAQHPDAQSPFHGMETNPETEGADIMCRSGRPTTVALVDGENRFGADGDRLDRPPALSVVATPGRRTAILELAVEAEGLGFPALACPTLTGAFGLSASLAHVTTSIRFFTAIQGIYGTAANEVQLWASHVHEVSGGRFALGLGVSHAPMVRRLGVEMGPPLRDMRSFVDALRANVKYGGELPPIYIAALRDQMLGLATEIGDGALWANASLTHTRRQVALVPPELRRGGFHLANMIPTVISDDHRSAAEINRRTMATYVRLPNYRNYWKACGYVEEMEAVERAIAEGNTREHASFMSERWLRDCTLYGTVDEVLTRFAEWREIGVEPIAVMSSVRGGQVTAIRELFDLYR